MGLPRRIHPGQRTRRRCGAGTGQLRVLAQVTRGRPRAALCAARLVEPLPERSPRAVPWRERPPETAAWPAKPAAREVVAHATAGRVLAPCASAASRLETTSQSTRNP